MLDGQQIHLGWADPLIVVLAVLVLGSAAFFAGYLPTRRAASIDPMVALRHD